MRGHGREILLLLLLAAAPVLAFAPAWQAGRLLAPGQAAQRDLPLRVEAWQALARGELPSWNPSVFSGTPLLAAYRPGALHPAMLALSALPPFAAFQLLVLVSLALTGPLAYVYLRRLGAGPEGGLIGALAFALGPYLVGNLGDTATVVAAPGLVLLLLALESHLLRPRPAAVALLAGSVALLLLAGSADAGGAGAILLLGRLALAAFLSRAAGSAVGRVPLASTAAAVAAGLLLAAPQLLPTLVALLEAGPFDTPPPASATVMGMAGLVVRSLSHTPAAVFALAAVPLVPALPGLRPATGVAVAAVIALAAGGQLEQPSPAALAVDLAFAVLCGLSFSVQWRGRHEPRGRRLRQLALIASLFGATALSIATTVTGPLDAMLAAPVGLLALGLILYFTLAESRSPVASRVFLLPLVASFLLQPWGRRAWGDAPMADALRQGTPTSAAIDRAMGVLREERALVLAEAPPTPAGAVDLAWANLGTFSRRRSVNGEEPLVPASRRRALEGMRSDGTLPREFLETDPGRLELLGVRWLQVPTASLATPGDQDGLGDELDVVLEPPRPHLFALPYTRATEVRIVSFLAGAVEVEQGTVVAECVARLANGREIWVPIRAGLETAEWAWERPDVRPLVKHGKPPVYRSSSLREGFEAHEYRGLLRLPGRFAVTALRFSAWPGAPRLSLLRVGLHDVLTGRSTGVSLASAYASDEVRLAQAADTPLVSLFQVRHGIGPARVVESLRRLPDEARLLELLRAPTRLGVDTRREALATAADAGELVLPAGSRASTADVARAVGGQVLVRASGPGLLVVAEGWDPGWSAQVDGHDARVFRVNADRLGIVLEYGHHFVLLRHRARGFGEGCAIALATLALLGVWALLGRRAGPRAV